jgi:hypothetical protein
MAITGRWTGHDGLSYESVKRYKRTVITVGVILLGIIAMLGACVLSQRSLKKGFYAASIIPAALFCLAMISDRVQAGYNTLLLLGLSLVLSFVALVFGTSLMIVRARRQAPLRQLIIPTLVAGLPAFYAVIRRLL